MYSFLKNFHSGWAYIVVIIAVVFLLLSLVQFLGKKELPNGYKKLSFFTTLSFHIQFLVGMILYFVSPFGMKAIQNQGMGEVMKDDFSRKLAVEHPMMMIAAVLFITIANAKIKRSETLKLAPFLFILIAVASVFAMIPYEVWPKFLQ